MWTTAVLGFNRPILTISIVTHNVVRLLYPRTGGLELCTAGTDKSRILFGNSLRNGLSNAPNGNAFEELCVQEH